MNVDLIMLISEIQSGIITIEDDLSIYEEINFGIRANTIDFIDFHILDRIEGLARNSELDLLKQRAEKVKHRLEEIDNSLFKQLREKIIAGIYTKSSFKEMLGIYFNDMNQPDKIGYDNLDTFINGLLINKDIPEPVLAREPEMVFYQQTPARIILEMTELAQLNPDDVFFDIGSGLGQVAILVNLISGAKTRGIEYEPAYCDYAGNCAALLNLPNVKFINTDARKYDYSEGTAFFMYTPFGGSMLDELLQILQHESQKRSIRIFTYGPCSLQIAQHNWLTCINGDGDDIYKLYEFRSLEY